MGDVLQAFRHRDHRAGDPRRRSARPVRAHPVPAGRVARAGAGRWCSSGPPCSSCSPGCSCRPVRTIYVSFLDDRGKSWVGFENYSEIFSGKDTRLVAVQHLHVGGRRHPFVVIVGLAIARFADGMTGEKVAKSLIFIPAAISLVGAGIIWKFVYAGPPFEVGLLNQVTKAIPGLPASLGGDGDKLWLVDRDIGALDPPSTAPGLNTFLLIVIFIWARPGSRRSSSRPRSRVSPSRSIEAARVDGATKRQVFYKVTLAVHPRHHRHRRHDHGDRRAQGLRHRRIATTGGNFGTSTIANEFYRDLLRPEPQRLRVGVRRADVPRRHPGRRHQPTGPAASRGDAA